jgi:hypothetical protein
VALVPRRIALIVAVVAALLVALVAPATRSLASDINAPTLLSPASSQTAHLKDIIFKWETLAGASEYQVQVSPNGEWTNNKVTLPNNGIVIDPTFEMPVSLPNATYYWHVRAQVGGVWGPYSKRRVFVKDWEAPITILKAPTSADPTLTWAPVKEASLYLVRYLPAGASFDSTPGQVTGEVDCWTANTSVTPYSSNITPNPEPLAGPGAESKCASSTTDVLSLTEGTAYTWELIAYDDSSATPIAADTAPDGEQDCEAVVQPLCDVTTYDDPNGFIFDAPEAGSPARGALVTGLTTTWHTSTLPGDACDVAKICPTTPTFSWDPVPGANFYLVNVYRDPDGSNLYRSFATSWPELTPSADFFDAQAGQPYYWNVEAGTCVLGAANPTCAPSSTGTDECPTAASGSTASKPTLGTDPSDIKAVPPGELGDQSVDGGTISTVTVVGTGILSPACIIPSAGFVQENTVSVGFGGVVSFTYEAPVASENQTVTFQLVNPDGGESNASAPLTVIAGAQITIFDSSKPTTFGKRSGPITLVSPANHATITGVSPTFKWQDFMNTGGLESYDSRNYELQVSQDRNFDTTILDDSDIDLTQYTNPTALLANGSYYWRVAAIDETGDVLTWSPSHQLTVNATPPTISFLSTNGVAVGEPLEIQTTTPLRNLTGQTLKVVPAGESINNAIDGRLVEGTSNTIYSFFPHVPLATGGTYALRLTTTVLDDTGNAAVVGGTPVRTELTATNTSPGWQYSKGWTRHDASGAISGSYVSASAGRTATLTLAGSEVTVFGCKAPHMGQLTISVAGQSDTVTENQSFTKCGEPLWHGAIPGGIRTLTLRAAIGTVDFDAVEVDGGTVTTGTGTGTTTGTGSTTTPPTSG